MKPTPFILAATAAHAQIKTASIMEELMALKEAEWDTFAQQGLFGGSALYPKISNRIPCINGKAVLSTKGNNTYSCRNVDLHAFLSHEDLGSQAKAGNDVWGWTSPAGREFGIVGQRDGVAFVEVDTKTGALTYLGRLDTHTDATNWRDIKVIGHHAYIGAESHDHGLQIFDLRKLEAIRPQAKSFWWDFLGLFTPKPQFTPKVFNKTTDITAHFAGFGASHNIVAHPERNMIYAVGGRSGANARDTPCKGGMFMVDVSDPTNPTSPGCVPQDGYVHDAQCVVYRGPDVRYQGREICFNFNEDSLTIMDLTDKSNPVVVSRTGYNGVAYSHQGWLVDEGMEWLLLDDELDERSGTVPFGDGRTTTYIWNVTNLENPINTGFYKSPARSIDHNQYVHKGLTYQANYASGLRIVDVSGVEIDPTGGNFEEVGFFDCYPEDDETEGSLAFIGTWSVYPYFKSGYILLNSIERGIFSLKYTGRKARWYSGKD
ncbi:uncharacterized protein CTHT_0019230 [Thermochaetoides thermophila DSM 1495]|uniref:Regulatory P domain-containing protein n=1 Tax=Chaetomium thermophilum (strain DSM 1495 / CBS 144.50 / IMI 039719) TaxID=759272 RepID=G0S309_CHATD|nr:hypothetical protein CTHT_0019230 [Thermochaetoides thermophila DSM 1495]EGS22392.1 hypothetical protein CTHT_0019230 [Thermochaetoides thermophila DSM 1495]